MIHRIRRKLLFLVITFCFVAIVVGSTCPVSQWTFQDRIDLNDLSVVDVKIDSSNGDSYVAVATTYQASTMSSVCDGLGTTLVQAGINLIKVYCNRTIAWSTFYAHPDYPTRPTSIDIDNGRLYVVSSVNNEFSTVGYVLTTTGKSSCVNRNMSGSIIKLDNGKTLAFGISVSPISHSVFVVGAVRSASLGEKFDAFIVKFDSDAASQLWWDRKGSSEDDAYLSVFAHGTSAYVGGFANGPVPGASGTGVAGKSVPLAGMYSQSTSSPTWLRQYTVGCHAPVTSVMADSDSNVYFSGYSTCDIGGEAHPQTGIPAAFAARVNGNDGLMNWTRFMQNGGKMSVGGVLALDSTHLLVAGYAKESNIQQTVGVVWAGGDDIFVARLSRNTGVSSWISQTGSSLDDQLGILYSPYAVNPLNVSRIGGMAASSSKILIGGRTLGSMDGLSNPSKFQSFYSLIQVCPLGKAGVWTRTSSGCASCPVGKYSDVMGIGSVTMCQDCNSGYFSSAVGAAQCTKCDFGTFASTTGASTCASCAHDWFQDAQAKTTCKPCPGGEISNLNQGGCVPAPSHSTKSLNVDLVIETTSSVDTTSQFAIVGILAFAIVCCCGTSTVVVINGSALINRKCGKNKKPRGRTEEEDIELEAADEVPVEHSQQPSQPALDENVMRYLQEQANSGNMVEVGEPTLGENGEQIIQITTTQSQVVDAFGNPVDMGQMGMMDGGVQHAATMGPAMGAAMMNTDYQSSPMMDHYSATMGPAMAASVVNRQQNQADTSDIDVEMSSQQGGSVNGVQSLVEASQPRSSVVPTVSSGGGGGGGGRKARVLFSYSKDTDEEISLKAGEIIEVTLEANDDWWLGRNSSGEIGYFPKNYVKFEDDGGASHQGSSVA